MCSIFGILGEYDSAQAKYAFNKLSHRGDNNCSIVEKQNLFFGHHRLSIEDKNNHANQPFIYKDVILSFNGEIYNFKELRQELSHEFQFNTNSDTEVILALYLKHKKNFVSYLRGMFAIAILDKNKLYLFRDRLGKKPLFYMNDKRFIFASEIKAIKPFLQKHELNNDALLSYLSYLAPTPPHTFFKGIYKLGAGEYLEYDLNSNSFTTKKYFSLLDSPLNLVDSEEEALNRLENIIEKSIALRLNSDIPTASLLSGGIDSATINAYAKKMGRELQTYTIGYKEYAKYDERENAKQTASHLGIKNKAIEISQKDFLEHLDVVLDHLDEPLNDPASVPLYILFKNIAKDGYKIVLSGEGSDELFLGYRQYFEFLDIEEAAKLKHKNWLKNYFKGNFSRNREWEYYKRVFNNSLLFRTSGENFTDLQKNLLLKQNIKDNQSLTYIKEYIKKFESSKHTDKSTWYSYIDLNLFQAEHYLTKLDRVSMAHTIEARTPFLDNELASFVFSLSPELRYKDGVTKSLLKSIARPLLSKEIIERKKKGFSNPSLEYIKNSKKIELINIVNKQTGLFKEKELTFYLEQSKTNSFKQHIWGLYVLSHWINKQLL